MLFIESIMLICKQLAPAGCLKINLFNHSKLVKLTVVQFQVSGKPHQLFNFVLALPFLLSKLGTQRTQFRHRVRLSSTQHPTTRTETTVKALWVLFVLVRIFSPGIRCPFDVMHPWADAARLSAGYLKVFHVDVVSIKYSSPGRRV